jgi:hypothetical protein
LRRLQGYFEARETALDKVGERDADMVWHDPADYLLRRLRPAVRPGVCS